MSAEDLYNLWRESFWESALVNLPLWEEVSSELQEAWEHLAEKLGELAENLSNPPALS